METKCNIYQIAEQSFEIKIVGNFDWKDYLRAIEHLKAQAPLDGCVEVNLIETKSSGERPPDDILNWYSVNPYSGELEGYSSDKCDIFNSNEPSVLLIDYINRKIHFWVEDFSNLPPNERAAPLRVLFHYWFRNTSKFMCHAAGLSLANNGVLFTGKGGSGKSTSTLISVLESELKYAGDDFLLVDSNTCKAFSLYNVAKLNMNQFENFPQLMKHIVNKEMIPLEKGHIYMNEINPSKMIREFDIKAILLPTITGQEHSNIVSCTQAESFKALTPSSVWILRADRESIEKMRKFINQVPSYRLLAGTQLSEIPHQIITFINEN